MKTRHHFAPFAAITSLCFLAVYLHAADPTAPTTRPTTKPLTPATRPIPAIDRVMVISVDGLRPDLLTRTDTPNFHRLIRAGSFTLWAKTTAASITLPSHISMLTGVTPNRHKIEWNSDLPLSKPVYPKGRTLLDIAKGYGYTTAMTAGKSKFEIFDRPGSVDWNWVAPAPPTTKPTTNPAKPEDEWPDDTEKAKKENMADSVVTEHAIQIIHEHRPQVMFVHFPHVDNVGHIFGWGTPEQLQAVEEADTAVGAVVKALDEAGLIASTLIIITADHGGAGRGHGPDDARSRHIPWIAVGPGIRANFDLTRYKDLIVNTEDTFATACYFLGMKPSPGIDGKPVTQIIRRDELLQVRN